MSSGASLVDSLFRLGKFKEIASLFDRYPDVSLTGEQLLIVAEAMVRTGQVSRAKRMTVDLAQRLPPGPLHARCELILGLVARESGSIEEGLVRLKTAARLAKEAGDLRCEATSLLIAFRLISENPPIRGVESILAEVRTLTTRAGDPHLTALLHESVAKHEAQVGSLDEARRHLRIARRLLESYPNAWLEQLCALNGFCIDYLNSDLKAAEQHLKRASKLADITGALEPIIANNSGHLQIQLGKFSEAETTLNVLAAKSLGEVLYGTMEGLGQLYLAAGRLDECERALDALMELEKSPGFTASWPFRSSRITRLRLLMNQSKWDEATALADVVIRDAQALHDTHFLGVALFLKALAHHRNHSPRLAAISALDAMNLGALANREYQAIFTDVCSNLIREQSHQLSSRLQERARRVCNARGALVPEIAPGTAAHVAQDEQSSAEASQPKHTFPPINSLAAVFDLAYNPKLVGEELKQLIEHVQCSPHVRLHSTAGEAVTQSQPSGVLPLGDHRGSTLRLHCEPPDDPFKAILLGDILRIGRAALELERAREAERSRAALWPADPVEDQGDAIFIAEEMQSLLATVRRIATTTVPVLITGETGTGK